MPTDDPAGAKPASTGDALLGGALLGMCGVVLVLSGSIKAIGLGENSDPGPTAFPIGLALLLGAGGMIEVWKSRFGRRRLGERRQEDKTTAAESVPGGDFRTVLLILASVLIYVVVLPWLGFATSTAIVATGMMVLLGNSIRMAAIVSLVMIGLIYGLFVILFKVPLPGGVFDLPF